ncbi:hypothetical protein J7L09_02390 [bacterium]|nr:hypothetical protein [bacterium]
MKISGVGELLKVAGARDLFRGLEVIEGWEIETPQDPMLVGEIALLIQEEGVLKQDVETGIQIAKFIQEVDSLVFPNDPTKITFVIFEPHIEKALEEGAIVSYTSELSGGKGYYSIYVRELNRWIDWGYIMRYCQIFPLLGKRIDIWSRWIGLLKIAFKKEPSFATKKVMLQAIAIHEVRHRIQDSLKRHFGQPFIPATPIEKEFAEIKECLQEKDPVEIDAEIFEIWWWLNHSKVPFEELPQILTMVPSKPS